MPRHISVALDGVDLSSVAPVLIQQVHEDAPALELTEADRPGRYGQRLAARKRQSLRVAVEFALRERFDLAARAHWASEILRWSRGEWLELSYRPDQRLRVRCTAEPALTEARNYAAVLRVEFTAYAVPYWEDKIAVAKILTGTSAETGFPVPGVVETPLELVVTPTGGTLTNFSVTAGGQTVALTGLSIPQNTALTFSRDFQDSLAISAAGVSQLPRRTAASADDLLLTPGRQTVSFTADTACTVTILARGRG